MDLEGNLRTSYPASYSEFESVFMTSLEANAPLRTKVVTARNKPYATKELRKAIMVRTNLKQAANKSGSMEDMRKYKDQRNLVVKLNIRKNGSISYPFNQKPWRMTNSFGKAKSHCFQM